MSSEGNMPRKVFEVPFQKDPRPDIYKQLTLKNAEYPVTDMDNASSYLPDFTRAVELTSNIYRINVPGYFYKCPSSSGSINSSGETGIIIDRYAFNMDNFGSHPHRCSWISSDDIKLSGMNDPVDGIGDHECFVIPDWKLYVEFQKDNDYTGKYKAKFYSKPSELNTNTFRPVDFSDFAPSKIIEGVSCQIAVRANMRLCPTYDANGNLFCRNLAMDYIVSTGKNSSGGIMNCLSAIIPGVATTTNASGSYQGSDGYDLYWSVPALGEVVNVHVTDIYFIKGKDLNKYYCAENELMVDGILEAKGTYVYPYRSSGTSDKILFVPAKAVGDDVKPVTKIRSTSSSHCTYNIPRSDTHLPFPNTSCSIHRQYKGDKPVWGTETGTSDVGVHISGTVGSTQINESITVVLENCGPVAKAHTSAFDTVFREIFYNPSLTGHKAKFLVQNMTLQAFPGTSNNKSSDITDSVTVKMMDPTSAGAS